MKASAKYDRVLAPHHTLTKLKVSRSSALTLNQIDNKIIWIFLLALPNYLFYPREMPGIACEFLRIRQL